MRSYLLDAAEGDANLAALLAYLPRVLSLRKEIIWETDTTTDSALRAKEIELILSKVNWPIAIQSSP